MPDTSLSPLYADRLPGLLQPRPAWSLLAVGAFGAESALALAEAVAETAAFLLMSAAESESGVSYESQAVNADHPLPHETNAFDLVLCLDSIRYAPREYDLLRECTRVLKPGGLLVIGDAFRPDDPRAGSFIDSFYRLRDPYHYRTYTAQEWRGLFLDLDLDHIQEDTFSQPDMNLHTWASAVDCSPSVVQRLQIMLAQAPAAVAEWLQPRYAGTAAAVFTMHHILIIGRKKDN